jgi:hypothetical protein
MTADPIPHDSILLHDGQRAVSQTDANRIDVVFAFQLLELQTGVRWISLEEAICLLSIPLRPQR